MESGSSPEDVHGPLSSSDDIFAQHESLPSDIGENEEVAKIEGIQLTEAGINSGSY